MVNENPPRRCAEPLGTDVGAGRILIDKDIDGFFSKSIAKTISC